MIDMVALPVWVGALIGWYGFDPQQAGLLATLFLAGQVTSSLFFAPRFGRFPVRWAAVTGFMIAALAFVGVSVVRAYPLLAAFHLIGGLGAGCALSMTHGLVGRSANPHRLFAYAGFALGILGIVILGGGPKLVAASGAPILFLLFGGVMIIAMLAVAGVYPRAVAARTPESAGGVRLSSRVWFGMLGMGCLALANAMIFSFAERIGIDRGYGVEAVSRVLMATGLVNLLPPVLAALLQRRLPAERVVFTGPFVYAGLAVTITQSDIYIAYAVAVALVIGVMIFTHTFLFGLLARLDTSGRATAATPAMLMIGSASGPLIGGTLVKLAGYSALGYAVGAVCVLSVLCFWRLQQRGLPELAPSVAGDTGASGFHSDLD